MDDLNAPNETQAETQDGLGDRAARGRQTLVEVVLLVLLFFVYAGDLPPMVNEAHYLVKAKNFWDPDWCRNDLFASSGKAHTSFYVMLGWPTLLVSLETTAWMGRMVGWTLLAWGLVRLCWKLVPRRYASLVVAVVWIAGIEYGNLAGEWVVGGIEAKVIAYGLMLLALAEMLERRWGRVWILLGAASAFHVLTGGWSVIAAMIAWVFTERGRQDACRLVTPALLVGGTISLFGLIPALALTAGASPQDSIAAARIYSYHRLKHHLLPADFYAVWYVRHAALVLMTASVGYCLWPRCPRIRQLGWFTIGAVGIAAVGLIIGLIPSVAPDVAAKLLRFYWFRLTDAVVPLTLGLLVAKMLYDGSKSAGVIGGSLLVVAITLTAISSYHRARLAVPPSVSNDLLGRDIGAPVEVQQQVFRDWLAVCRWARLSSQEDAVFLTPRHQQTFKWYAGRAEVVNWKDVPQDAASLREWDRRFQEIFPDWIGDVRLGQVRVTIQYSKLLRYREVYGAGLMVVDRRVTGPNLPLVQLYPTDSETNQTYAVYELPLP
jgi:hypothetical protein